MRRMTVTGTVEETVMEDPPEVGVKVQLPPVEF